MAVRSNTGAFISGIPCIHATVTKTSKRKGDTFSCKIPLDVPGAQQFLEGGAADITFSDGTQTANVLTGKIDHVAIEWIDREISISGRDKGAVLSESRVNKQYKNQKSSEIIQDLAQQAGLQAQVQQSTGGDAGKIYNQDTVHMLLNKTPFEALSWLAERDGCRWFVDSGTLFYQPKEQGNTGGAFVVTYSPPNGGYETCNAVFLNTSKNMSAAKKTEVKVKSWHQKDKKLYSSTASGGGSGDTITYEHHFPGMTQQQVETIAKSHLSDYTRHALSIDVEMPGDVSVDVTGQVELQGTGTEFDTSYDIDSLTFTYMAGESGHFTMAICGKTGVEGSEE